MYTLFKCTHLQITSTAGPAVVEAAVPPAVAVLAAAAAVAAVAAVAVATVAAVV